MRTVVWPAVLAAVLSVLSVLLAVTVSIVSGDLGNLIPASAVIGLSGLTMAVLSMRD